MGSLPQLINEPYWATRCRGLPDKITRWIPWFDLFLRIWMKIRKSTMNRLLMPRHCPITEAKPMLDRLKRMRCCRKPDIVPHVSARLHQYCRCSGTPWAALGLMQVGLSIEHYQCGQHGTYPETPEEIAPSLRSHPNRPFTPANPFTNSAGWLPPLQRPGQGSRSRWSSSSALA